MTRREIKGSVLQCLTLAGPGLGMVLLLGCTGNDAPSSARVQACSDLAEALQSEDSQTDEDVAALYESAADEATEAAAEDPALEPWATAVGQLGPGTAGSDADRALIIAQCSDTWPPELGGTAN